MPALALAFLLQAATPAPATESIALPPPASDATVACALQRLKPFVGPYGIRQAWPVADALPAEDGQHVLGTLLSDTGPIADGYQQFLHIDAGARAVFVVEQGGFAGTRKVFGPLPLPRYAPKPPPAA